MKIELNGYALDGQLGSIITELRKSLGKKVSKHDKDTSIGKAVGAIETLRMMMYIYEDEPEEGDTVNVQ